MWSGAGLRLFGARSSELPEALDSVSESIRLETGTTQRRSTWPLRKDDTHKPKRGVKLFIAKTVFISFSRLVSCESHKARGTSGAVQEEQVLFMFAPDSARSSIK